VSTINLFRSALDNNYEAVQVSDAVSIREALPGVDFENAVLSVNGFQVDENYILRDNDLCTIRLFPKGGKGGWNPIDTALTIGLFLINPYLGVAYAAASGLSYAFSNKTLGSWFLDKEMENLPGTPNSPDSLVNIPQLRGAKNQSNKNKPIPLVLGKHLYTPMYIGSPYTEIGGTDGEDQYYTALYLLGWGKLKVSDIRLGPVSGLAKNTDISGGLNSTEGSWSWEKNPGFFEPGYNPNDPNYKFKYMDPSFKDSNPQLELRQGASEVSLYQQKVVEERLNIHLINIEDKDKPSDNKKLDVIRFSAKNPQKVQVEITFNQGLISYNDQGKKKDATVGILIEWRANPNVDKWYEFGRFGTSSSDKNNHSPTDYRPSTKTTTITRQKAKVMRFVAERPFSYNEVKDFDRTVEIRVIRTTPKPVDDNRTSDTVYLTAIRTWCFDNEATMANNNVMVPQVPMIQKYRDLTARLGFRIKATDNLQGTIDALNCIVESYARTWNGSAWSTDETPTNNPASVALKVLQSPALGNNAYPDKMLDLDSFGEFYRWCDEDIFDESTGKTYKRFICNGVLTAEKRVDDILNVVLSTGRGMRILNGNRYGVLIDKPRENPVMILNSQNVLEAKNEKAFEDLPDGFSIKFVNELDGYQETEINVMADGSAETKPSSRMESIELPFVTDYKQAVRNGWYMLACRHLRPEIWHRKLSVDGYLLSIGNRVEVQDDTIVVGLGEGARIKNVIFSPIPGEESLILEIQTDGEFDVSDITNKQFGIKIMHYDGVHDGVVRTIQVPITEPGLYSIFVFNPPIELPFTPQPGDLVAFGEYSKITTPAICFGKKANGDGTFEVTLIPYQEGIYTTDEGPIPPYEANVTTPQKPYQPQTVPEYVEIINERITNVINNPVNVNREMIQLILSIQSRILEIDKTGKMLAGYLPFTSQAVLYRGGIPVLNRILHYPGGGRNIFDPMLGSFTPGEYDGIVFSLVDPPAGVSISKNGIITVSENAALETENYITVQAEYQGRVYRTKLHIRLDLYTPKYLGPCYTPTGTQTVLVRINGEDVPYIAHQGDWVAYLDEDVPNSIWKKGYCMRWTGIQWEQVQMEADGNFESNPYIAALLDLTENAPRGTFLSILVRDLIAKTAMIERLFSHKLRIQTLTDANGTHEGAIYGGGYDENGNNPNNLAGFYLGTDGKLKAVDGIFSGIIDANDGIFKGELEVGPLSILKGPSAGKTLNYPIGTSAKTIFDHVRQTGYFSATGTYGGTNVNGITITHVLTREQQSIYIFTYYDTKIFINGGALIAHYRKTGQTTISTNAYSETETNPVITSAAMNIAITLPDKLLRLMNLPTTKPTEPNIVYRNEIVPGSDNYFLAIS